MQKWLDNNNILMCSTHNKGKSVIAESFLKTLKSKAYKRMTVNDSKSYLPYLNNLIEEFNNTYHYSIDKKPITADFSALSENIESNPKVPKFKVNDRVRITKHRNIFSKGYTENLSRKIFFVNSVLKTNTWTYRIEYLNGG